MYLLDTNVISELRKVNFSRVHPDFAEWASEVSDEMSSIATPSIFEIERGIEMLRRRDSVQAKVFHDWFESFVLGRLKERILCFDLAAARATAQLPAARTLPVIDSMLAGVAETRGLIVATRNVKDFEDTGVPVVNPWDRATWR